MSNSQINQIPTSSQHSIQTPQINPQNQILATSTNIQSSVTNFSYNIHYPNVINRHHYQKKQTHNQHNEHKIQPIQLIAQQVNQIEKEDRHQKKLPHIKLFDDKKEFNESRPKRMGSRHSSHSQLPQVYEAKKQLEDQKQIILRLNNIVDKDEFNSHHRNEVPIQISNILSSITPILSLQSPIQPIRQSQEPVQQKQQVVPAKSAFESQIQKIIVDQVDDIIKHNNKIKQEEKQIQVINEEKNEDDGKNRNTILHNTLQKIHQQNKIYKKIVQSDSKNEDQIVVSLDNQNVTVQITEQIQQKQSDLEKQ